MPAEMQSADGELPGQVAGTPRSASNRDFAAPVTLGRPRWAQRHAQAATAIDLAALGSVPCLYLLWDAVTGLPLVVVVAAVVFSTAAVSALGRGALRLRLHHLRANGRALSTVLAVGTAADVATLTTRTDDVPRLGWWVIGACTPTGAGPDGSVGVGDVPVLGDLDAVATVATRQRVDAVAVHQAPGWSVVRLQQLADALDGSGTALLVDPQLTEAVAGTARMADVPGLPLCRVDSPTLTGLRRVTKDVTDRLTALLLLVLVWPVLVSCALAVRRDGGPVLRHRSRLGLHGTAFSLLSFRTTTVDDDGLTPVGTVLHRYGLAELPELPELLNVVGGSMALVGPRPAGPTERAAAGRLLLKPGIIGLRHLDRDVGLVDHQEHTPEALCRYAAGWTPARDARIVFRSLRAALD